jgi:hypothetical protein
LTNVTPHAAPQDRGCGFQAERIADLVFRRLLPELAFQELVDFLDFLSARSVT